MKRLSRILGVTLLEIMLVLAVASLVIVLSIRYYQSTQTALAIQQIQRIATAIIAFADSYGLSSGTYTGLDTKAICSSLPVDSQANCAAATNNLNSNWGPFTFTFDGSAGTSYTATLVIPTAAPASVCQQVAGFIGNVAKSHLTTSGCTTPTVSWTYALAANS